VAALGYRSHIYTKGQANRPLNERQQAAIRRRSKIRARVEHVFASQAAMGGQRVRTIGLDRDRVKIALNNIVYNLRRWTYLQGITA
jgi:IS5 family transposase